MIRWLLQSTPCLILCPLLAPQQVSISDAPADTSQTSTPVPVTPELSRTVRIKNDTLVLLRPEQDISSADLRVGDKVRFTLENDIVADGEVVVRAGTTFYSTITSVRPKTEDRDGQLGFSFTEPELGHGKRLRLIDETTKERKDIRDEEIFWLTYGTIILAPFIVIELGYAALHPRQTFIRKDVKRKPQDMSYPKGKVIKFYVQKTMKIRMDQLAGDPGLSR
jgi:hypothetical protein